MTNDGDSRRRVDSVRLVAPHHVDLEVASTLRAQVRRNEIDDTLARSYLATWVSTGIERFSVTALLPRIWELRDNLTPYDAGYVALAEALECDLVTADERMARAPGPRCSITVVKS